MNPRQFPFCLPSDIRSLLAGAGRWFVRHRYFILAALVALVSTTALLFPHDPQLLVLLRCGIEENSPPYLAARWISKWGDFYTGSLIVFAILWITALFRNNPTLRRAAVASVLAAAVAGIAINGLRLTTGRPRPSANLPDGFYGLQASPDYHAFPSGHSATAMGTATALAVVYPPAAIPALVIGATVPWSRLVLERHHPTDLLVGSALGMLAGLAFGRAVRSLDVKR